MQKNPLDGSLLTTKVFYAQGTDFDNIEGEKKNKKQDY